MDEKTADIPGGLHFHHIGVATKGIEAETPAWTLLGYAPEGEPFEDPNQGIRGQFLTAPGHPRLELLENLPGSRTLDGVLKRGQKLYHTAYYTEDIEGAAAALRERYAQVVSPLKPSPVFGKRVCFLMLPNMAVIELLER